MHRPRLVIDEIREFNDISQSQGFTNNPGPTDTTKGKAGQPVRTSEGSHAPSGIPKEYTEFKRLF